jgi:hypothetical protein
MLSPRPVFQAQKSEPRLRLRFKTTIPFTLEDVLVKGDLLLLVVILLATTLDWTVVDFLLTPKRQADLQWANYAWFCATFLVLVFYTLVYGWLVASRLPGGPSIRDPQAVLWFTALSAAMTIWYCGYRNYQLLLRGKI